jgi:hypothetical protein
MMNILKKKELKVRQASLFAYIGSGLFFFIGFFFIISGYMNNNMIIAMVGCTALLLAMLSIVGVEMVAIHQAIDIMLEE